MQPPVLAAAPHWRRIDFISDLHLQPACAATAQGWRDYLAATPADALFILGDLFEVWVGDDLMQHDSPEGRFAAGCAAALRDASRRLDLHLMRGNRDFLLDQGFAQASGARLLPDPLRLDLGPQRWLLTHGDALCLDDVDYLAFRAEVRSPAWQQAFLAQPLAQRLATARALRARSEARKQTGRGWSDLDAAASVRWLQQARAEALLHGHTHRPGRHDLGGGHWREVLGDWDLEPGARPRAPVLSLVRDDPRAGDGWRLQRQDGPELG